MSKLVQIKEWGREHKENYNYLYWQSIGKYNILHYDNHHIVNTTTGSSWATKSACQ